jgi:RNA polymerase sigma-70 factor (ECF subfamily)
VTVSVDQVHLQAVHSDVAADFETTFQQHWPRVYAVIFRMVGDRAEAEDLALEVFWRLHRKLTVTSEVTVNSINGWLYRVATNLGLNAIRARQRREQYELEAGKILLEASPPQNPVVEVERAEERQRVRKVLSQMKARSAKILVLRYSGLSYAEIAAAVKVSPKSVGTLLNRAERDFEKRFRALE